MASGGHRHGCPAIAKGLGVANVAPIDIDLAVAWYDNNMETRHGGCGVKRLVVIHVPYRRGVGMVVHVLFDHHGAMMVMDM